MIKKPIRIILAIILILLAVTVVVASITFYRITDGESICSAEDMKYNAKNINDCDSLPPNFYAVWDRLFPDSRNVSMLKQFLHSVYANKPYYKKKDCRCDEIAYNSWNNHQFDWKYNKEALLSQWGYFRFGLKLQRYSSPERCFDFWMNHDLYYRDEQRYFRNMEEFSLILFNKSMGELNDEELIDLIARRLMSSYPTLHPEYLEKLKGQLLKKWSEEGY